MRFNLAAFSLTLGDFKGLPNVFDVLYRMNRIQDKKRPTGTITWLGSHILGILMFIVHSLISGDLEG